MGGNTGDVLLLRHLIAELPHLCSVDVAVLLITLCYRAQKKESAVCSP